MPALSIIVPVYKVEQYLRRCVDSILAQTFTDFELILVDDGSLDNCPAICDEYAEKDNRIVVIHKENGGLSDARNAGLDIAKGDYIGFVDSDDWIHPQMYEIMVGVMNAKGVDIVKCDCLWTHDNEVDFDEMSFEKALQTAKIIDGRNCVDNFYPDNRRLITDMAWDKLYKKKIFSNIRYPKGHIFEDAYILLNLLDEAERIAVIDSVLYFYYQRNDSITGVPFSAWRARERMITWERHREFFEKKGNITQKNYVLNAYIKYFYHQKMRIYVERPKDKKLFKPAQKAFNAQTKEMFSLDDMCNMKRLMLICLRFYPKMADKIVKKYFPELL